MVKSRRFWLFTAWTVLFGAGTTWAVTQGSVGLDEAALVGAVGASVVTAAVARIGK